MLQVRASKHFPSQNSHSPQALILLYFVHWRWHRLDLSLDAVIKFFACGFIICGFLALTIETIQSYSLGILFDMCLLLVDGNLPTGYGLDGSTPNSDSPAYADWTKDHFFVFVLYFFVVSFLIAALTEEMCKYYCFQMVDHPDIVSRKTFTGTVAFPETSLATGTTQHLPPQRTHESFGAGITVAMVTVAVGFSCCENLIYIFRNTGAKNREYALPPSILLTPYQNWERSYLAPCSPCIPSWRPYNRWECASPGS